MTTPLEAAKHVLTNSFRHSLVDYWIRHKEFYWTMDKEGIGKHVAEGYQGKLSHVSVLVNGEWVSFRDDDAKQFIHLGHSGQVEFN